MVSGCLNKQHSTGLCDGRRWSSQWKIRSTASPVKSTVPRASSIAADGSELWQSCEKWWYSTGLGAERWCEKMWRVPRSDDFFHHFFCGTMSEGRLLLRWLAGWVRGTCQNFFQSLVIKCFGHFYFMSRTSCYSYSSMTICIQHLGWTVFISFPGGKTASRFLAGDEVRV